MNETTLTSILKDWSAAFMRRSMHEFLRFTRRSGLSMTQMNVLMRLHYHGPCEISDLLEVLEISKAGAGQLVERMELQGLVISSPAPHDRRARLVQLTEKGSDLVSQSIEARLSWISELLNDLPPEELPGLAHALQTLAHAASQKEDSLYIHGSK